MMMKMMLLDGNEDEDAELREARKVKERSQMKEHRESHDSKEMRTRVALALKKMHRRARTP